ncbi:MAG: MlaD family protein [Bacteroidaceae bacterium]|nr:MlaD family protein [Bacteroidaceae bacterium]
MNFFTKEVKIGITAIIAIIIIYTGIIFLKGLKLFSNDTAYYVEMDNANGLSVSSEVLANGVNIGLVKTISYIPEKQNILVQINVKPDFKIPNGTTAFLSKEMLGSPKMNLALGQNDKGYMKPGDTMKAVPSTDLMATAGELLPQVQSLIPKLDSILAGVNTLVNDPALATSLHNLEYITNNLKTTTDDVNSLLGKDMPKLMTKANTIAGNLEITTNKLNQMDLVGMANSAQGTLNNVNNLTQKLDNAMSSKNNSLGLLLNDNSLVLHMDTTVQNASLLLEDLRLNPKRYVHFSLFGKKSK